MIRVTELLLVIGGLAVACVEPGGAGSPLSDVPLASDSFGFVDGDDDGVGGDAAAAAPPPRRVAVTHHRLDGNRYAAGRGSMGADAVPSRVPLSSAVEWVVGAAAPDGSPLWLVSDVDGLATLIRHGDGALVAEAVAAPLAPGQPPAFEVRDDGGIDWFDAPLDSGLTHPITTGGVTLFVDRDGLLAGPGMPPAVPALPDARILLSDAGLLLLGDPTSRYTHAALGDGLEAEAIVWIDDAGGVRKATVAPPQVIEGIAPLWGDLDGDGHREVVVTVSDSGFGARLRVYGSGGEIRAEGPPVGMGFRWLHQLAVAPFGPDGEVEIAAVRTPHIAGVAEFYRYTPGSADLERVAEAAGYTSHLVDSRNLDNGLAADVDGDGVVELLVPNVNRDGLCALSRPDLTSVAEDFCVSLGGAQRGNVAAVSADDRLWVGVATGDGFQVY